MATTALGAHQTTAFSMSSVVYLKTVTRLDIPADRVLEGAMGELESVIVIGHTTDGNEYFASSMADGGNTLWLLERFKTALLNIEDE